MSLTCPLTQLHHSQREIASTEHYTDFSFDIRPTSDFLGELLRHSNGIEVLEPLELREKMRQMIAETLKRDTLRFTLHP